MILNNQSNKMQLNFIACSICIFENTIQQAILAAEENKYKIHLQTNLLNCQKIDK
jgi:hypothetical protein